MHHEHQPRRTFVAIVCFLAVAPFAIARQTAYPVRQMRIAMDGMGPHIGSGALKVIGVIGPKRSPALSGVASLFEQAATDAAFATPGRAGLIKQSGITLD